ncbi:hypothetical protein PAHAL_1G146000 [Panicum hallii]|uniref:Uncharacterized protein n=1 Tax=Panicum hallii TaxID=206008 RepID=A0A2T8KV99_9POAL|nr:hypothetical protein PAHAL_1G146000 [Panicum hallii]
MCHSQMLACVNNKIIEGYRIGKAYLIAPKELLAGRGEGASSPAQSREPAEITRRKEYGRYDSLNLLR